MSQQQDASQTSGPGSPTTADAKTALKQMLDIMGSVSREDRHRIIQSLVSFFDLSPAIPSETASGDSIRKGIPFSEEKILSPKEFLFQKKPLTDVERVATLAYYLTHYRDTPYFKTLDISKLNTEAAQAKFSNPAYAVDNATRYGYLVPASRGNKQLSAVGELFVQALPDREAAKEIAQSGRPKRRAKKGTQSKQEEATDGPQPDEST
jgi:hypothetical protein